MSGRLPGSASRMPDETAPAGSDSAVSANRGTSSPPATAPVEFNRNLRRSIAPPCDDDCYDPDLMPTGGLPQAPRGSVRRRLLCRLVLRRRHACVREVFAQV